MKFQGKLRPLLLRESNAQLHVPVFNMNYAYDCVHSVCGVYISAVRVCCMGIETPAFAGNAYMRVSTHCLCSRVAPKYVAIFDKWKKIFINENYRLIRNSKYCVCVGCVPERESLLSRGTFPPFFPIPKWNGRNTRRRFKLILITQTTTTATTQTQKQQNGENLYLIISIERQPVRGSIAAQLLLVGTWILYDYGGTVNSTILDFIKLNQTKFHIWLMPRRVLCAAVVPIEIEGAAAPLRQHIETCSCAEHEMVSVAGNYTDDDDDDFSNLSFFICRVASLAATMTAPIQI